MYSLRNSRSEGLHLGCKFSLTLRLDRAPRSQSAQCKRAVPVLGFISSSAFRCPARPHLSKLLCKGCSFSADCRCFSSACSEPAYKELSQVLRTLTYART